MSTTISESTSEDIEAWEDGNTHHGKLVIRDDDGHLTYSVRFHSHQHWSPITYTDDELNMIRMMAWADLRALCQRPVPSY